MVVCLLLAASIAKVESVTGNHGSYPCHGDFCNRGREPQFCSSTFEYCRNCKDVVDSCGTPDQPINCTSFCVDHLTSIKFTEKRDAKCHSVPNIRNGHVNATNGTDVYDPGDVLQVSCSPGFKLEYTGEASCGSFGKFRYNAPECKAITCNSPPVLQNGKNIAGVAVDVFPVGFNVSYNCYTGYSLYGARTLTCTLNGIWETSTNTVGPVCVEDKSNGWMYACFVLSVVLLAFICWHCVKFIRQQKQQLVPRIVASTLPFRIRPEIKFSPVSRETDIETGNPVENKHVKSDDGYEERKSNNQRDSHEKAEDSNRGHCKNAPVNCRGEMGQCCSGSQPNLMTGSGISEEKAVGDKAGGVIQNKVIVEIINFPKEITNFPKHAPRDEVHVNPAQASETQTDSKLKSPTECTGETVVPKQPESAFGEDLNLQSLLSEKFSCKNYKQPSEPKIGRPKFLRSLSAPAGHGRARHRI